MNSPLSGLKLCVWVGVFVEPLDGIVPLHQLYLYTILSIVRNIADVLMENYSKYVPLALNSI